MNQDLLKYFIPLQPMIKKAMGDWKICDKGIWKHPLMTVTVIKSLHGVLVFSYSDGTTLPVHDSTQDKFIRIPLTIDPVNPKRGLWGMLEGHKTLGEGTDCVVYVDNHIEVTGNTPTEAILKALCQQEGLR